MRRPRLRVERRWSVSPRGEKDRGDIDSEMRLASTRKVLYFSVENSAKSEGPAHLAQAYHALRLWRFRQTMRPRKVGCVAQQSKELYKAHIGEGNC
ncbi:hypothetical protein GW17_00054174 [Ensete ventricosum]|nr:hypothetical protein GW17_00054174 [Ensete ventricosum]